jgi:hypothetical protein
MTPTRLRIRPQIVLLPKFVVNVIYRPRRRVVVFATPNNCDLPVAIKSTVMDVLNLD